MEKKNVIVWSVVGVTAAGLAVLGWINRELIKAKSKAVADKIKEQGKAAVESVHNALREAGIDEDEAE